MTNSDGANGDIQAILARLLARDSAEIEAVFAGLRVGDNVNPTNQHGLRGEHLRHDVPIGRDIRAIHGKEDRAAPPVVQKSNIERKKSTIIVEINLRLDRARRKTEYLLQLAYQLLDLEEDADQRLQHYKSLGDWINAKAEQKASRCIE